MRGVKHETSDVLEKVDHKVHALHAGCYQPIHILCKGDTLMSNSQEMTTTDGK